MVIDICQLERLDRFSFDRRLSCLLFIENIQINEPRKHEHYFEKVMSKSSIKSLSSERQLFYADDDTLTSEFAVLAYQNIANSDDK